MIARRCAPSFLAPFAARLVALACVASCGSGGPAPSAAPSSGGDAGGSSSGGGGASNPDAGGSADGGAPSAPIRVTLLTLDKRQFVSATGGGGSTVTADASTAGPAQTLTVTDETSAALTDGDTIHVAASNGDYVGAVGGGGGDLTADAVTAGVDQTFVVHRIAGPGAISTGDLVSLETKAMPYYVSAIDGGGGAVRADAPAAKGWESFWIAIAGQPAPVDPAKQKVLSFLASIRGKKTVAGQHDKDSATPTDATDQVTSIAGRAPAMWSGDFLFGADMVAARPTMIAQAKAEWAKGSIVQLMYHACAPTGDESCTWDDIGGATPQHLTDAQWADLVTDGGTLNEAWKARLDELSVFFAQLQAAGVAPLFRPEHEMNQPIFWWAGRPGPEGTARLFQMTHDYLVGNKGFRNIIWVWDLQDFATLTSDVVQYAPGPDYFDIAALDYYDGGYLASEYATMQTAAAGKLIAIGECSTLPTADELAQQPDWSFFMLWPDFIGQNAGALPALYAAPNVVTLGQMPGW